MCISRLNIIVLKNIYKRIIICFSEHSYESGKGSTLNVAVIDMIFTAEPISYKKVLIALVYVKDE